MQMNPTQNTHKAGRQTQTDRQLMADRHTDGHIQAGKQTDIYFLFFLKYFFVPCGELGSAYPGKAQQPQEQRYPFLSVCAVCSCVQTFGMAASVCDF